MINCTVRDALSPHWDKIGRCYSHTVIDNANQGTSIILTHYVDTM